MKVTFDLKAAPAVIAESIRCVLKVYGLELTADLLRELGNNTAQALYSLDESLEVALSPIRITGWTCAVCDAKHPADHAAQFCRCGAMFCCGCERRAKAEHRCAGARVEAIAP